MRGKWLLTVAGLGGLLYGIDFGVAPSRLTGFITLGGFFAMQVFYALGPGLCVWLVLSELMPQRIRANGMGRAP